MSFYPLVVSLHNLVTVVLILGLVLLMAGLWVIRRSIEVQRICSWVRLAEIGTFTLTLGAVLLLLTGGYLMYWVWKFNFAWLNFSLLALLLITPLVPLFISSRLRVIRETAEAERAVGGALRRAVGDSSLWAASLVVGSVSLGIAALMVLKPSGLIAFAILLVSAAVALVLAVLLEGQRMVEV